MNETPMVSIITPAFNCSPTLRETAETVMNQTYKNWEWLITDDCSDEETKKVLLELSCRDSRIKINHFKSNHGAAVARNDAISRSSGDFIAFIDSDDLWDLDKLQVQVQFMQDGVNFSFTAYSLITEKGQSLNKVVDRQVKKSFGYDDMLKKQATLGCSTVMLRKRAFSDLKMPLLRTGQDYALWLKLLRLGERAYLLPRPLTNYRIVSTSISRNKYKKAMRQWQIYRKVENLGFVKSCHCFCFYAIRAIFRR